LQQGGSPLHPDVVRKDVLYPILDRLRIARTPGESGFHTFRHSAASILNERTGNLKLTQKLLGHSNISTTADVYTHISEESEREAALTVEEAICGGFVPDLFPTGNKTSNAAVN
jgi:integrase